MAKQRKRNCWEIANCGREPEGSKSVELGVCPAATSAVSNGTNQGINAGRCCWAVVGTFCEGAVQGTFGKKFMNCQQCSVYLQIQEEEGRHFTLIPEKLLKPTAD